MLLEIRKYEETSYDFVRDQRYVCPVCFESLMGVSVRGGEIVCDVCNVWVCVRCTCSHKCSNCEVTD